MPQWNCACANCQAAREGRIPARTQSSVALSADGAAWYLVNASPDLRQQIESFPPLQPRSQRGSPIAGVLLTNADLDHTLGLFLLREGSEVAVSATPEVRASLADGLNLERVLATYGGLRWHVPPVEFADLAPGLEYRAHLLPGQAPRYAAAGTTGQSLAYEFRAGGRTVVVAPDVAEITAGLQTALQEAALVLFDGTFWEDDELRRVDPQARLAHEMGHLPLHEGSLKVLGRLPGQRVLVHLNNTNPVLQPASRERLQLEAAGITVVEDGWEWSDRSGQ